jgi:predicted component of type VI protein secretion system
MSRRIEYTTLNDELIDSRSINMTPEEFRPYARERLQGEAKRITQPYDPNRPRSWRPCA